MSESIGERYIASYLDENGIDWTYEVSFGGLNGTGGGRLTYDFGVDLKNGSCALIEYQGIQHYEPQERFGGQKRFTVQKEHDRRKREFAKKSGYTLIEIPYTCDTYEKVAEVLNKQLVRLIQ